MAGCRLQYFTVERSYTANFGATSTVVPNVHAVHPRGVITVSVLLHRVEYGVRSTDYFQKSEAPAQGRVSQHWLSAD